MVLARNENYWGKHAYLDNVVLNLAGGVSMAMYENDEIDITGVGLADLTRVQDPTEELNKDLVRVPPHFSISYVGFNITEPPFDDPKFRQALNYAVDKQLISEQVYSDLVMPAYGILPPGFPGYSDEVEGIGYDPEKGKAATCRVEDFIDILFYSESSGNHGKYSNQEVDRRVEQARTEQDIIRRVSVTRR
ncbi:Heme-binding protein A [Geodia barretti]|uniref:Heme-binding protein A n=1 Tax=Geodia barretti TaxID=519541 RepID=A0AA35RD68_GEOBA|nr:Heme-binding protein A [Geodia barretti]